MTIFNRTKKKLDFAWVLPYSIIMNNQTIPSLRSFQVVAVHRTTGQVQFASVTAPSQVDADDFVTDIQPDWIVIRDNSDLLDERDPTGQDETLNQLGGSGEIDEPITLANMQ